MPGLEMVNAAAINPNANLLRQCNNETNFEYWSRTCVWTLDEAVALTLGVKPSESNLINLREGNHAQAETNILFSRLRGLVTRAQAVNKLVDPIKPPDFVRWTKEKQLSFPTVLETMVTRYQDVKLKPKSCVENSNSEPELGFYEATSKHIEELKAEIARLRQESRVIETNEQVNRKSFNTLLKLVGGLALAGYGFNPNEKRSDVISTMQTDLLLKGVELEADTIRKWVKEGTRLLVRDESVASKPK